MNLWETSWELLQCFGMAPHRGAWLAEVACHNKPQAHIKSTTRTVGLNKEVLACMCLWGGVVCHSKNNGGMLFRQEQITGKRERECTKDTLALTAHIKTALRQSEWEQQMPGQHAVPLVKTLWASTNHRRPLLLCMCVCTAKQSLSSPNIYTNLKSRRIL